MIEIMYSATFQRNVRSIAQVPTSPAPDEKHKAGKKNTKNTAFYNVEHSQFDSPFIP
jgi:hypothetical protein